MGCLPSTALTLAVTHVCPQHMHALGPAALTCPLVRAPRTPLAPGLPIAQAMPPTQGCPCSAHLWHPRTAQPGEECCGGVLRCSNGVKLDLVSCQPLPRDRAGLIIRPPKADWPKLRGLLH